MKIHPVFHVSLLCKYVDPKSIPDHTLPDCPPPVTIDNALEYEVESILDKRTFHQKMQYLVKWKSYHESDCTWELVENLENAKEILAKFERQ